MVAKLEGNILLTGGTGTLGHAIAARAMREGWPCRLTIYSRDPIKQQAMRREFPRLRYVLGDVCDHALLRAAAAGQDLIIHAAAQKHIPEAEANPRQCYAVNVCGSLNVLDVALAAGVPQVLAISTDKACHPVNAYGATKLMMERLYQQAALQPDFPVKVNLCRYGNVINSTGSVLEVWHRQIAQEKRCYVTDPNMTRFWLSAQQAVDLIMFALGEPSGTITIPRLPALSMAKLLEYRVPFMYRSTQPIGLRPGEKLHECLLTEQEAPFAEPVADAETHVRYTRLHAVTGKPFFEASDATRGYTSDRAPELTQDELQALIVDAADTAVTA